MWYLDFKTENDKIADIILGLSFKYRLVSLNFFTFSGFTKMEGNHSRRKQTPGQFSDCRYERSHSPSRHNDVWRSHRLFRSRIGDYFDFAHFARDVERCPNVGSSDTGWRWAVGCCQKAVLRVQWLAEGCSTAFEPGKLVFWGGSSSSWFLAKLLLTYSIDARETKHCEKFSLKVIWSRSL